MNDHIDEDDVFDITNSTDNIPAASSSPWKNEIHNTLVDHLEDYHTTQYMKDNSASLSTDSSHIGDPRLGVPVLDINEILKTQQENIVCNMQLEIGKLFESHFKLQNERINARFEAVAKANSEAIAELNDKHHKLFSKVEKVEEEHKKSTTELNDIKSSQIFLSKDNEQTLVSLNNVQSKLTVHEKDISALTKENSLLKDQIQKLTLRHDNLEQYGRRLNLEIHGIPEEQNEDPIQIVKNVAKLINVAIRDEDISTAHRLPSNVTTTADRCTAIIARFCRQDKRDEMYRKKTNLLKLLKTVPIQMCAWTPYATVSVLLLVVGPANVPHIPLAMICNLSAKLCIASNPYIYIMSDSKLWQACSQLMFGGNVNPDVIVKEKTT